MKSDIVKFFKFNPKVKTTTISSRVQNLVWIWTWHIDIEVWALTGDLLTFCSASTAPTINRRHIIKSHCCHVWYPARAHVWEQLSSPQLCPSCCRLHITAAAWRTFGYIPTALKQNTASFLLDCWDFPHIWNIQYVHSNMEANVPQLTPRKVSLQKLGKA